MAQHRQVHDRAHHVVGGVGHPADDPAVHRRGRRETGHNHDTYLNRRSTDGLPNAATSAIATISARVPASVAVPIAPAAAPNTARITDPGVRPRVAHRLHARDVESEVAR